jgi:ABC-type antimicrobial peptide transport system permease subunit
MQTATPSVSTTAVGGRYGLLTGLVSVLISFGIYALEMEQSSAIRFLTTAVLIAGIILAMRSFKLQNAGFMGYGQGIGVGVVVSGVVGLLSGIFIYVYTNFVDPNVVTRMMDKARTDMEAKGTMSDAQIDQAMAWSAKFTTGPAMLAFAIVGTIVIGLIISLIAAAFVKNPKPEFE